MRSRQIQTIAQNKTHLDIYPNLVKPVQRHIIILNINIALVTIIIIIITIIFNY